MKRSRYCSGVRRPAGNAVGYRISSTRMKTMFGRLPGCAAAAAALSKIPRLATIPPAATAPLRCRNSRRSMSLLVVDGMVRGRRHEVLEDAHQLEHTREAPHLAGAAHRAAEALVLAARHPQAEVYGHEHTAGEHRSGPRRAQLGISLDKSLVVATSRGITRERPSAIRALRWQRRTT